MEGDPTRPTLPSFEESIDLFHSISRDRPHGFVPSLHLMGVVCAAVRDSPGTTSPEQLAQLVADDIGPQVNALFRGAQIVAAAEKWGLIEIQEGHAFPSAIVDSGS